MAASDTAAKLSTMDTEAVGASRGRRIKERAEALGLGPTELAKLTGWGRTTIHKVYDGIEPVRESTLTSIETVLAAVEREHGHVPEGEELPPGASSNLVTFRLAGDWNVEVTVQGPIENIDELQAAAGRLIREIREGQQSDS